MKIIRFLIAALCLSLTACGGGSSSGVTTYTEDDMPAAIPAQFQGWWKGKSEWDYLHLAPDGFLKSVFPQDLKAPLDPALTRPNASAYLKVIRNQGDTLYAISKEQRYDYKTNRWLDPIYYYVMLHFDFTSHILSYEQRPCRLTEKDLERPAEEHLRHLTTGTCTINETQAGQQTWKRVSTYYRAPTLTGFSTR